MKVVICGAGIAGLALAHRLSELGSEVVVVEKARSPREQGYLLDFYGLGYGAAEAMGLLPRLRELSYRITEASYLDKAGRRRARLDYQQFARVVDGRLLSLMRPDLERALREGLDGDVDLRFATSVAHVDNRADGVRVAITDGSVLDADLLVGADGIHSAVRGLVFGAEREYLRYLGFHTAGFAFDDPGTRAEVGERFCLTDTTTRQVGLYGLRGERVGVFTVHRTPDPALPDDPRAEIQREYGALGWIIPRALAHCPPASEVYYDQVAQIEMPRWSRDRVTLVGDACQAVSMFAGQGASLAVAAGNLLAELLIRAESIEAGLREYERVWRPVVARRQAAARRTAGWFLPESGLRLRIRRLFLRLVGLPGSDRYLAAMLSGSPTELPQRA
jgi:2-polyprenyl-6-methoxyphenol hydroxylase-like FAD-dependent oxidoreductase